MTSRFARQWCALITATAIVACAQRDVPPSDAVAAHPGYRVQQSIALHTDGAKDAKLELLEDSRITPAIRTGFQRGLPDDVCARPTANAIIAFCGLIRHQPLRSAMVRFADTAGHDIDTTLLERPIADVMLVIHDPAASRRVYGVSVDLSAEAGSYSGPYVRLLDQRSRRFDWLRARDSISGQTDELHLVTTLKTGWQVASEPDGSQSEILVVACRPTFADAKSGTTDGFQVEYDRYTFVGDTLERHRRTQRGCWESDAGSFPPRSRFP
ncbi:MAG TPA: hypothetical protein VGM82_10940 [Gemmatimonadaceae bacterium]